MKHGFSGTGKDRLFLCMLKGGTEPMSPVVMGSRFVYQWICIFLVGFLLSKAGSALHRYSARLGFAAVTGLVI